MKNEIIIICSTIIWMHNVILYKDTTKNQITENNKKKGND